MHCFLILQILLLLDHCVVCTPMRVYSFQHQRIGRSWSSVEIFWLPILHAITSGGGNYISFLRSAATSTVRVKVKIKQLNGRPSNPTAHNKTQGQVIGALSSSSWWYSHCIEQHHLLLNLLNCVTASLLFLFFGSYKHIARSTCTSLCITMYCKGSR